MKKTLIYAAFCSMICALLFSSCGNSSVNNQDSLKAKKAQLDKLVQQQNDLTSKINVLQSEITKLDPSSVQAKTKLVSVDTVSLTNFSHYIDLQGKIDAQNVAYVAPKGQGGVVTAVYVKQGDAVNKGQTLLKLDDASLRQNVIAAQQQLGGIKAQLAQAKSVYDRQQNLWKENIGTELQVLNAKTAVESLQSQYNAAQANVRLAQTQINNTEVKAEISGVLNIMNVKVGELFSAGQQIQIVNNSNLKVTVNVPENYSGRVHVGSVLDLTLPDVNNKEIETKVNVLGKLIDPINRTFYVEGKVPNDPSLRPNQVAMVRIKDYNAPQTIAIPVNTIQNDEQGKYIFVATNENGKLVARKRTIVVGEFYHDAIEVKSGLKIGDIIITDGFQNLYDGQPVETGLR